MSISANSVFRIFLSSYPITSILFSVFFGSKGFRMVQMVSPNQLAWTAMSLDCRSGEYLRRPSRFFFVRESLKFLVPRP